MCAPLRARSLLLDNTDEDKDHAKLASEVAELPRADELGLETHGRPRLNDRKLSRRSRCRQKRLCDARPRSESDRDRAVAARGDAGRDYPGKRAGTAVAVPTAMERNFSDIQERVNEVTKEVEVHDLLPSLAREMTPWRSSVLRVRLGQHGVQLGRLVPLSSR